MKIYISHAEKDRALAEDLIRRLTEAGFEPWNPYEEIFPGDNWARKNAQAMDRADLLVALLTPHALKSDALRRDIQFALTSRKFEHRLFSVLVGATFDKPNQVPWILWKLPHVHVNSAAELDEATKQIQALVNPVAR